jgi:hypothetical protein
MATKELERLRLTYTASYSAYLDCLHRISAQAQRGVRPTEQMLREELDAFHDFAAARQELLRALMSTGALGPLSRRTRRPFGRAPFFVPDFLPRGAEQRKPHDRSPGAGDDPLV